MADGIRHGLQDVKPVRNPMPDDQLCDLVEASLRAAYGDKAETVAYDAFVVTVPSGQKCRVIVEVEEDA